MPSTSSTSSIDIIHTRQLIHGGCLNYAYLLDNTQTVYHTLAGGGDYLTHGTTEVYSEVIFPVAGVIKNLRVRVEAQPGSGKSWAFTIRKNAANTSLTSTISNTAQTANDNTNQVIVAAGDRVCIAVTPTGSPTAAAGSWCVEFCPHVEDYMVMLGNSSNYVGTVPLANNKYLLYTGSAQPGSSSGSWYCFPPFAGTIRNLYVRVSAAPGAGTSVTFTVNKNNTDTAVTCTISGTGQTASDTTHSVTVAAGDQLSIHVTTSGAVAAMECQFGTVFDPDTAGWFWEFGGPAWTYSGTATNYVAIGGARNRPYATEANLNQISNAFVAKAFYATISGAPGVGKSVALTLRRNDTTDTTLTATFGAADTVKTATSDVTISDGDLLTYGIVPSGSPSAQYIGIGTAGFLEVEDESSSSSTSSASSNSSSSKSSVSSPSSISSNSSSSISSLSSVSSNSSSSLSSASTLSSASSFSSSSYSSASSESSLSLSSNSSSSSSSSSSGFPVGWTWGCETPPTSTTPVVWTVWKYRESATEARNSGAWGDLQLRDYDSFVSDVKDSLHTRYKSIKFTYNDCDIGDTPPKIYWRGSDTEFAQDDVLPSWTQYTGWINTTYRYLQIRVDGA